MKFNTNLLTQGITVILYALYAIGLDIDPNATAAEIAEAIMSKSPLLIVAAAINFGGMVYYWVKTWRTDRPNFWAFLTSRSWLLSAGNFAISLLATIGLTLAPDTVAKLVDYGLAGDWRNFATLAIITLIGFLGTAFKSKLRLTVSNLKKMAA